MSALRETDVSLEIYEKLSKYKVLETEVTKMWHLKTTKLPAVISPMALLTKAAPNIVSQNPGGPSLAEVQKLVPMDTALAKGTINLIFFNTKCIPYISDLTFSPLRSLGGTCYRLCKFSQKNPKNIVGNLDISFMDRK